MKKSLTTLFLTMALGSAQAAVKLSPYEFVGPKETKVAAEVGEFQVPENRNNPNSRKLTLKFVKFPTTSKTPKAPIVYLAGGPGGSATGTAKRQRFPLFMKLREVSDVILYDQRGTGLSNDIESCNSDPVDIKLPTEQKAMMEKTIADLKSCVSQWQQQGIDLNGYNTKQSAADLVALTEALGVEKVSLWGISYGTHLAFATVKYYPQIIDNMVLASSEGLDQTVKLPGRVQGLLEKTAKMLQDDPGTAAKYPDMVGDLSAVIESLKKQPKVVQSQDFRTKEPITVGISHIDIQFALSYVFLRDPEYLVRLPRMVKDMKAGNYAEIASYVAYIKGMSGGHRAMSVAMDAASGISAPRWKLVQQQAETSLVGRTTNFPFPDVNAHLPIKDAGEEFRTEVESDIKTLFFAGTLDGRTLYQSQKELADNFSNRAFVTVDGAGHNLFMSHPKVGKTIYQFLMGNKVSDMTIELPKLKFE